MVRRFGARAARMVRDGAAGLYSIMREMVRARMPAGPVELQPLEPHPVEKPEVELTVPAYHRVALDAEVVADPGRHISSVAFDEGALDEPAGSVSEGEESEERRKKEVEGMITAVDLKLRLLRDQREALDRAEAWVDRNQAQERLPVIEEGYEEDYARYRDLIREPLPVTKGPRVDTPATLLVKIPDETEDWASNPPVAGDEAGADAGLPATPAAGAEDGSESLLPEPGSAAGGVPSSVLEPEKEKEKVSARNRF